MKQPTSGQPVTCQGQELFVVMSIQSGSVAVTVKCSDGADVPVDTYTTSKGTRLPGHPGAQYTFTFSNATVDVYGA